MSQLRFLLETRPWSDESLLGSYQMRLRERARVQSWAQFVRIANSGMGGSLTPLELLTNRAILAHLGRMAFSDGERLLADFALPIYESAIEPTLRWHAAFLPAKAFHRKRSFDGIWESALG